LNKPHEVVDGLTKRIQEEFESKELVKLDDDFYTKMLGEIFKLNSGSEVYLDFKEHVTDQLVTLFSIRLSKVLNGAIIDTAARDERIVFHKYAEFLRGFKNFIRSIKRFELGLAEKKALVIFNSSIQTFADSTMRLLGPFEKNDMAYIPEEDALLLSRYGLVEILEGEKTIENT
jgi:DNA replication initiation complex subunit (GINS family)